MNTATMRRSLSPVLAFFAFLIQAPVTAQHFPRDEDLRLMLQYLVEDRGVPGVVLGVLDTDGSTRTVAFGHGEPGSHPPGPHAVFEIGYLTMTFTATLLAEMAESGEVALDDPVAKYLPAHADVPSPGGYEMALSDLATHRSGLTVGPPEPWADLTPDDLYDILSGAELVRPGRRYDFSPLGYALLGHALARAAGTSYPLLLRDRVLDPLGMQRTGFALEGEAERMPARPFDGEAVARSLSGGAMHGATGLQSTVTDMLAFLAANARPPRTALERAMRTAQAVRIERGGYDGGVGYGFSWRTYGLAGNRRIVAHAGVTDGFSARLSFDPLRGIGTVLLANNGSLTGDVGRALLSFEPMVPRQPVQVDAALLSQYAGSYSSQVGRYRATFHQGRYFIRLEPDGFLTYQGHGRVRMRLYADSDSSFYALRAPYSFTFSAEGDAVRMVVRVDERAPAFRPRSWTAWKVGETTPPSTVVAGTVPAWTTWGPRTWVLLGAVAVIAVALIMRRLWRRRTRHWWQNT